MVDYGRIAVEFNTFHQRYGRFEVIILQIKVEYNTITVSSGRITVDLRQILVE